MRRCSSDYHRSLKTLVTHIKKILPIVSLLLLTQVLAAQPKSLWEKSKKLSELYKGISNTEDSVARKEAATKFFTELHQLYGNQEQVSDFAIKNELDNYDYLKEKIDLGFAVIDAAKELNLELIRQKELDLEGHFESARLEYSKVFQIPELNQFFQNEPLGTEMRIQINSTDDLTQCLNFMRQLIDQLNPSNTAPPIVTVPPPSETNPIPEETTRVPVNEKNIKKFIFEELTNSPHYEDLVDLNRASRTSTLEELEREPGFREAIQFFQVCYELEGFLTNKEAVEICSIENKLLKEIQSEGFDLATILNRRNRRNLLKLRRDLFKNHECYEAFLKNEFYEEKLNPQESTEIPTASTVNPRANIENTTKLTVSRIRVLLRKIQELRVKIEDTKIELTELQQGNQNNSIQFNQPLALGLMASGDLDNAQQLIPTIVFQQQGSGSVQSSIIDGASKWIADRMREELNIAFFDRFERWLDGKNIKTLFPNSFSSIKSSLNTDYELMIKIFKSAFEKDLNQMPFNLAYFIANEFDYDRKIKNLNDTIRAVNNKISVLENEIAKIEQRRDRNVRRNLNRTQFNGIQQQSAYNYNSPVQQTQNYRANELPELTEIENKQALLSTLQEKLVTDKSQVEQLYNNFRIMRYVVFTIQAIELLNQGEHPTTLLTFLNQNSQELFPNSDQLSVGLSVLDVLSRSLIPQFKQDSSSVWIKGKNLSETLRNDPNVSDFFFGLVHREVKRGFLTDTSIINREIQAKTEVIIDDQQKQYRKEFQTIEERFKNFYFYTINTIISGGEIGALLKETPELELTDRFLTQYMTSNYLQENNEADEKELAVAESLIKQLILYMQQEDISSLILKAYPTGYETSTAIKEATKLFDPVRDALIQFNGAEAQSSIEGFLYEIVLAFEAQFKDFEPDSLNLEEDPITMDNTRELVDIVNEDPYFTFTFPVEDSALIQTTQQALNQTVFQLVNNYATLEDGISPEFARDSLDKLVLRKLEVLLDQQEKVYIDSIDVAELINDPMLQELNFKMDHLNNKIQFTDNLLSKNTGRLPDLFVNFVQYADQVDFIRAELKELQKVNKANLGSKEFIFFIRNSLEVLYQAYEIALPDQGDQTLTTIKSLTSSVLDAYESVLEKDFDAIVMNILPIAETLVEINYKNKIRELKAQKPVVKTSSNKIDQAYLASLINEDGWIDPNKLKDIDKQKRKAINEYLAESSLTGNAQLSALLEEKKDKISKMHEIFKYGAFLAAVVESRDADAIKSAIQAIALPSGSYSIKRRTLRNISLNAFPGLTGGIELATNNSGEEWAPNFGFTAPIGLAFSWGYKSKIDGLRYYSDKRYRRAVESSARFKGSKYLGGHSGSIFFPLIDLGAIVLFRLDNTDEALPQDVGFQQIFSPGVMYGHGFPNIPLTLMAGVQVSPKLRTLNDEKANAIRMNLSLVVDLPMANFYTQARKNKQP